MQLFNIPVAFYLAFVNLHLLSGHPVPSEIISSEDIDILKVLLRRLEESIPEQTQVSSDHFPAQRDANVPVDTSLPEEEDYNQPQNVQQPGLSVADVKDFLSARDLKAVRSDSPKRYSACFGRRMERIGSMTSLGCNTVGRSNRKRR